MLKIALILVATHAIVDFFIQPDWLRRKKSQFLFLTLHSATHAIVTYMVLQDWAGWKPPLFIFLSHGLIDYFKQRY